MLLEGASGLTAPTTTADAVATTKAEQLMAVVIYCMVSVAEITLVCELASIVCCVCCVLDVCACLSPCSKSLAAGPVFEIGLIPLMLQLQVCQDLRLVYH